MRPGSLDAREQKRCTEQGEGDRGGLGDPARVRMARLIAHRFREEPSIGAEVEPRRVLQQHLQADDQDRAGQRDGGGSRDPPRNRGHEQSSAGERDGYGCPGLHGDQPRQHALERCHVERPAKQDSEAERERYQPACSRDYGIGNSTATAPGNFSRSALGKLSALGAQRERLPEEHAQQQKSRGCSGKPPDAPGFQNDGAAAYHSE